MNRTTNTAAETPIIIPALKPIKIIKKTMYMMCDK